MILAVICQIMYPAIINLKMFSDKKRYFYQDETGVYQLQVVLAFNEITDVTSDTVYFSTIENDCELHIVNGKLISQPGTVDYIHDIDEVCFYVEEDVLYMQYDREGRDMIWPIGYYYD